jgi:tRNA modification GTPase
MLADTIAALATPPGEGGLAVVRISGPGALIVADQCFQPAGRTAKPPSAAPSHTIHFGHVVHDGHRVDEVLLAVLRAPRTFTREDVVEISCHGGTLVAKLVLGAVLAAGARLAHPGEFTQRAFLNGRLDLAQAEAVADLIHSRTDLALRAAHEQLAGGLSQRINHLRDDLMQALAHVEAHLDFPDEDIAPDTQAQLLVRLERGLAFMDALLRTAGEGQILRHGIRAAIVGRPNAGKSSLLNQLLGHDRAIVSPIPGTTRDTIEEAANIRGLPVIFTDTAGLRAGCDALEALEAEGIRRSHAALAKAELILHVLDASESLTPEDECHLAEFAGKKRLLVCNKTDLPPRLELPATAAPVVNVSCLTGDGLEALRDAIKSLAWFGQRKSDLSDLSEVTINSRHEDALQRAYASTERAIAALNASAGLELVALELRLAVNAVGEVVGKTTTEDLLDAIFSTFCLGK